MNKKIITIVILIMMVLSALFMFRRPWLNSNQEALDYMNARYSFDDGTIEKLTYLQKKHSIELGDYMQYYVTFENGKKSIIRAYVKMHNHLTMIGPDFYIKSCRVFDRDIVMEKGKYMAVRRTDPNTPVCITIRNDNTYDMLNYPNAGQEVVGTWTLEDNFIILRNDAGEEIMRFITDGSVLIFQKHIGETDNALLEDGDVFILE